mmetsp:Transcript_2155/g.6043  ORF Transcript_2155/g.6043 Transcript_2155/m.6043 type:complete len:241 (-) Transcript_2155:632-1354(-)
MQALRRLGQSWQPRMTSRPPNRSTNWCWEIMPLRADCRKASPPSSEAVAERPRRSSLRTKPWPYQRPISSTFCLLQGPHDRIIPGRFPGGRRRLHRSRKTPQSAGQLISSKAFAKYVHKWSKAMTSVSNSSPPGCSSWLKETLTMGRNSTWPPLRKCCSILSPRPKSSLAFQSASGGRSSRGGSTPRPPSRRYLVSHVARSSTASPAATEARRLRGPSKWRSSGTCSGSWKPVTQEANFW